MASHVFAHLKDRGEVCELASEFVKELVWRGEEVESRQFYVAAAQWDRIHNLLDKVEVIVTDSPLLQQLLYTDQETLKALLIEEHNKLNNLNIVLTRSKPFVQTGRLHSEEEARALDVKALQILRRLGVPFTFAATDTHGVEAILTAIERKLA